MSNPDVREIGTVTCVHGSVLRVGVDYDAVTINGVQLGPEARDDFARLYFQADGEAKAWAVANPDDEDEASATVPGQLLALVYPCCKHCEADNAEYGTSCSPPRHLTPCANGCDDAGQASGG